MILRFLALVALLVSSQILPAQFIQELPLETNPVLQQQPNRSSSFPGRSGIVCPIQTVSLPFYDDFSGEGPYPDCNLWQDNNAYVNRHLPISPRTVGVATLDGLKPDGTPYNPGQVGTTSNPSDTLTSQLIDLSNLSTGRATLFFQLQRKGLGDEPELSDSLVLELLDTGGVWITTRTYIGDDVTIFTDQFSSRTIVIDDAAFHHANFQFRFRNFATSNGNNDHWHIDMVYLDEVVDVHPNGNLLVQDFAFAEVPQGWLSNYSALPYNHFVGSANTETSNVAPEYEIFNFSATDGQTNFTGYQIDEPVAGISINPSTSIPGGLASSNSFFSYQLPVNGDLIGPMDLTTLNSLSGPAEFITTYEFGTNENDDFPQNNTVTRTITLDDYFAYDDGSAETRIIAQGIGTVLAVKFTANVDDSLRGFFIHLPYFLGGVGGSDFINVKVWQDSLSEDSEILSDDFIQPADFNYASNTDSLNAWWTYAFSEPLFIPAGTTFFVGWQQGSTNPISVGFDRNNTTGGDNHTFFNALGTWDPLPQNIQGSIMIRPVLRSEPLYISSTEDLEKPAPFRIFPNPSNGLLFINGEEGINGQQLQVYNTQGQLVKNQVLENSIDLGFLPAGLYTVLILDDSGAPLQTERIVLQP